MTTEDPREVTPVELREGMWYKREDLFRLPNGVNGSKLRMAFHLIGAAKAKGVLEIVSAAPILSPQSPIAATVSKILGLSSVTIVGGTTPEKALKHESMRMASEQGSEIITIPVGYTPALHAFARRFVEQNPGAWEVTYGIPNAPLEEQRAVTEVTAAQVANIPDEIETIVMPFGSGNTAAGVLYGLSRVHKPANLKTIVLMTIGPDKYEWLTDRLSSLGVDVGNLGFAVERVHLHPMFSAYSDKMPETLDDIVMHPTYEGKVVRYLNLVSPLWWAKRDGKTLMWVVGGPV